MRSLSTQPSGRTNSCASDSENPDVPAVAKIKIQTPGRPPERRHEALSKINGFDQRITGANNKSEMALEGLALAMALADPVLSGDSIAGIRGNWGNFEGHNAWGATAIGILHPNVFGNGERFGLAGSVGATESGDVSGRVGAQLAWK